MLKEGSNGTAFGILRFIRAVCIRRELNYDQNNTVDERGL